MRDPNRLDKFYTELCQIHKEYYPDLRFGQFMMNFLGWVQSEKQIDPFFPEESRMLEYLHEYTTRNTSPWRKEPNL